MKQIIVLCSLITIFSLYASENQKTFQPSASIPIPISCPCQYQCWCPQKGNTRYVINAIRDYQWTYRQILTKKEHSLIEKHIFVMQHYGMTDEQRDNALLQLAVSDFNMQIELIINRI
jgi:hypothetical protein